MTGAPVQVTARVLLVGDDAEVVSALYLDLARAGSAPFCIPCPETVSALLPSITPQEIVLVLPRSPGPSWGAALTAAASAARAGVRVVLVAPSREVVEPLAAVAGADRALARADVLARPLCVLERSPGPHLPPPLPQPGRSSRTASTAGANGTPSAQQAGGAADQVEENASPRLAAEPLTLTPSTPAPAAQLGPPRDAQLGRPELPTVDLLALIDEELARAPRNQPRTTRVEVNVSLVSEHNFYVGATRRVDSGGVFISTMLPPAVGTPLEVRLGLPDSRRVDAQGEVTFVRERGAVTGRQSAGCGVKLHGLPSWAVEAIERFMAARPPILYVP